MHEVRFHCIQRFSRKKRCLVYVFGGREKGTTNVFSSYKLTSKLRLVYLEVKLLPLLHLVIKMQKSDRNKVLRGKQTPSKVQLLFLDEQILEGKFDQRF